MQAHQLITTVIDGQEIQGVIVYRTQRELTVVITFPYSGLSDSRHIPYFAAGHYSFKGIIGDQRAESLLQDLYQLAHRLSNEFPDLRDLWPPFQAKIDEIEDGDDAEEIISFNIRKLRAQLKAEKIDQRNYQRVLTSFKIRRLNRENAVSKVVDSYFDQHAPYVDSIDSRRQVVQLLQGSRETLLSTKSKCTEELPT